MITIPLREDSVSDQELFAAFDLTRPDMQTIRHALECV